MTRNEYELSDRYLADDGDVYLTGVQALVRLPIEQLRRDRDRGRTTAAFVSGYPGSPLGGFDLELHRALALVPDLPITHLPAVNEELGASAVMGSQLAPTRSDCRYDGVVGIWYGKSPGLDRATDALRHGVFAGSSRYGGALALVGDDPSAKSSTMPSSSDAALVDLHMPVLYPMDVRECLELGLHGVAMSRATGLWSALKVVTAVADGTGTVRLPVLPDQPIIPTIEVDGETWTCEPSAQFLGPRMVAIEKEFHEIRSELALRYGVENRLNRITSDPSDAWIGLVATGFTYSEVLESLRRLGIADLTDARSLGIRVLQLRMPIPFDGAQIVEFARGLDEIVVIEEKNPTLERLVRDALYDTTMRPRVIGKLDPEGTRLLPSHGRLDADAIAPALLSRLASRLGDRLVSLPPKPRERIPLAAQRSPFFCSGCPHNTGTRVPEGAVVGMGTGCHGMTLLMDEERVGDSIGITAMGNEGAQWLGMAPFVETDHVFQNFGDGTYLHSGQLAIQAAVGAGVSVTFKILYNHTVAMTGGQEPSHRIGPARLATVLLAHGVERVVITTDDPEGYDRKALPDGVRVEDRRMMIELQQELASVKGVTVLIHDQECAAELRRARKRNLVETPRTRVVINHRICEGCGDCGDVSNCLSVQPVETPLGRKTSIDQASCNFDFSCLRGDCPAFMTIEVEPGQAATESDSIDGWTAIDAPEPSRPDRLVTRLRMAGIGGTGVVTAAQILGTAATLAGSRVAGIDQTGLSQKAGPVISDLTISDSSSTHQSNLIGEQQADVLLAFDELVAAAPAVMSALTASSLVVASSTTTPIGRQISDPTFPVPDPEDLELRLGASLENGRLLSVDAATFARALTGTEATANTFMVGVAVQAGQIPIPVDSIRRALELNGAAVRQNLAALEWGRRWFERPDAVAALVDGRGSRAPYVETDPLPPRLGRRIDRLGLDGDLDELVRMLASDLVEYQHEAYAGRFLDLVDRVRAYGHLGLTTQVARNFHKLLAYKDEYEVARLMLRSDGLAAMAHGSPDSRTPGTPLSALTWHLHPPALRRLGFERKIRFGGRSAPMFRLLARGKRLRGTSIDPFGRDEVRRVERELIDLYESGIAGVCESLGESPPAALLEVAESLAGLPDQVRGFEQLKLERANRFRHEFVTECDRLRAAAQPT